MEMFAWRDSKTNETSFINENIYQTNMMYENVCLERLIKPSKKGWFQAKQLLCLDKRKGKTESPQYFSIL